MTAVATRVEVPDNAIARMIADRLGDLGRSAYKGYTPDVVLEMAMQAAIMNPDILKCTPQSVFKALSAVSRWGLAIGDGVHLVPYKTECTAVPDYKGLKALAYRQGICRLIQEYPIYEGDHVEIELGLPGRISHQPCTPSQRGELVGAWILIHLPGGLMAFHYLHIDDIEKVRANSFQWGPRKIAKCPPWYAMKTVVRNWLNKQPKGGAAVGGALSEALAADEVDFEIVPPSASVRSGDTPAQLTAATSEARLPGDHKHFAGHGGKLVAEVPKAVLEQFTAWAHEKGERAEKHAAALAAAEERLVAMVDAERRGDPFDAVDEEFPS